MKVTVGELIVELSKFEADVVVTAEGCSQCTNPIVGVEGYEVDGSVKAMIGVDLYA